MTSIQQRAELQRRIWQIANDVRGTVDGWDFKQYVLGALFYRFISENFAAHMEAGDDGIRYAELPDSVITPELKDDAIKTKGYFIYPSQLFANVVARANTNDSLNTDLAAIFTAIESSANGYPSEQDIKGLFADFDTTSNRLGNTVKDKTNVSPLCSRAWPSWISAPSTMPTSTCSATPTNSSSPTTPPTRVNRAASSFTPQHVSRLIARLALHGQKSVNKIYDPACGSGSLLLQAKNRSMNASSKTVFGQESNHTTYNLARMNMFLHNINYDSSTSSSATPCWSRTSPTKSPLMPSSPTRRIR